MRFPRKLILSLAVMMLAAVSLLVFVGVVFALPSEHPFEVVPGSFSFSATGSQAGAHDDWVTTFDFAHVESGSGEGETYNDDRTNVVNLPAGFDANNTVVPTCTSAQLFANGGVRIGAGLPQCPIASQVGQVSFELANDHAGLGPAYFTVPLFNMETTAFGTTAELGFKTVILTQILHISVRPNDEGLTVTSPEVPTVEPRNIRVVVWGLPASHVHDAQRGEVCGIGDEVPAECYNEYGLSLIHI